MDRFRRHVTALILYGGVCLLWPLNAHAYLDPGTGSSLLQILLAALFTVLFCVKLAWARIKAWTGQGVPGRKSDEPANDE
jgi:hypothetical protein